MEESCLQVVTANSFFILLQYPRKNEKAPFLKVAEEWFPHPSQALEVNVGDDDIKFLAKITDASFPCSHDVRNAVLLYILSRILYRHAIDVRAPDRATELQKATPATR